LWTKQLGTPKTSSVLLGHQSTPLRVVVGR
jgi:hypothetical protein